MRQAIATLVLLAMLVPARQTLGAATPADARKPVERLTETLLATMKAADRLSVAERRDKLAPVLRDVFDFRFMTRIATGSYWRELSEKHQDQLVDRFTAISVATYAARFDGYTGQRFEIGDPSASRGNAVRVPTQLVKPDGGRVAIDYLVRPASQGDRWQIVDVYLKGRYSELATRRSEYTSVLKNKGYRELMERMNARIGELTSAAPDG